MVVLCPCWQIPLIAFQLIPRQRLALSLFSNSPSFWRCLACTVHSIVK
jgi:hypothetical protein